MRCIDCGYLASDSAEEGPHKEYLRYARDAFADASGHDEVLEATWRGWEFAHCYRGRWHGSQFARGTAVAKQMNRPRFICRTAYPYSEGSPEEHRVSHRARTTRRWFVASGFLGVFAIIAAALITNTPPPLDVRPTAFLTVGAAGVLGVAVLAFNLLFVRD